MSVRLKNKVRKMILTIFLATLAIITVFPLVLTITNSLMSEVEITQNYQMVAVQTSNSRSDELRQTYANIKLIPDLITISQLYEVLVKRIQFLLMFWNSVIITVPIVLGQIAVATMAAYAFAKLRFPLRQPLFFIYIIVMLLPFQVTLVPNYIIAERLGILNSYLAIIFPGIFSTFGVFLLKQYLSQLPDTYLEAARVDGAGHFEIFWRIILPQAAPGMAVLAILVFMDNWNMVEQPLIFLQDAVKQPLSVYLAVLNEGEKGIAFAAATIYMAPMLLIFLYGENYLVEGIQLSGIKG
jgi:multiple sugar transport system permease protein